MNTRGHALVAKPMRYHGPGWFIDADDDRLIFQLWAPNERRSFWQAAWTWVTDDGDDLGGDCRQAASAVEAVAAMRLCPWLRSGDALGALLVAAMRTSPRASRDAVLLAVCGCVGVSRGVVLGDEEQPVAVTEIDLSSVPDEVLEREVRRRRAARSVVLAAQQMPYGWRLVDGRPVENAGEQRIRCEILRLRQCSLTLRDIAETLNERGLLRAGGVRWRAEQVRRVLLAKAPGVRS